MLIVFLIYAPTLSRDWQMFDEKEIYQNESLYPTPVYFSELLEILPNFVFNSNFESQNLMFSNIINIRSNTVGATLNVILSFFFKKNPFSYHLLSLCIHLLNTALVWCIFLKVLNEKKLISTIFTLIWALHPANVESVMMSTNWNSIFAYTFFFGFFLYNLKKIINNKFQNSIFEFIVIAFLTFCCTLFVEYSYMLPVIIFFISFALVENRLKAIINSFFLALPYFFGILLFAFYYFVRNAFFISNNSLAYQSINFSLERLIWFSPQIFLSFLKMFFYPRDFSIFQSNLVTIADSMFSPYAIFAFFVLTILLLMPIIFSSRPVLFLIYGFIFSAFPFLHILLPAYCIFAERYCYFPFFVLIFLFANLFAKKGRHIGLPLLIIILILLSGRTVYRLNDWKDSFSLYSSAVKSQKDNYHKGLAYSTLGYYFNSLGKKDEAKKYMLLSLRNLEEVLNAKQKKNKFKPKILKVYGLDSDTKNLNAAFRIAYIKLDFLNEAASEILKFYSPYIEKNLNFAGNSQLDLYAKLLLKNNETKKALEVLEFAKEKYLYSPTIIFSLSSLYVDLRELTKAEKILKDGFSYYPNYKKILPRLIKLYELKNDQLNLAKYEYLLGLRNHSQEAYQKALQIYLGSNMLKEAKSVLDKLLYLDKKNPVTLLLLSKYYLLNNEKDKVIKTLNEACQIARKLYFYNQLDVHIYESILLSLISFNISYSNYEEVKKYILELEQIPEIYSGSKLYTQAVKKKFNL